MSSAAQVAGPAINFHRVPLLETVVGADRDFDQLRAGNLPHAAHHAVDRRDHGVWRRIRIDALGIHHARHAGDLLRELAVALDRVVELALGLMQLFGRRERRGERLVAGLFVGADVFAEAGHFVGQPLIVGLRRGDGGRRVTPFGPQLFELGQHGGVAFGEAAAFGFQLANLLLGRFDFALELALEPVVIRLRLL